MSAQPCCEQILELYQDALDERLRPEDRPLEVNVHLTECTSCREEARQLTLVHEAGLLAARHRYRLTFELPQLEIALAERLVPTVAALLIFVGTHAAQAGQAGLEEAATRPFRALLDNPPPTHDLERALSLVARARLHEMECGGESGVLQA